MIAMILRALARPLAWLAAIWAIRADAARDARLRGENATLNGYVKTREEIDNAEIASDAFVARDLLRARDPNQP